MIENSVLNNHMKKSLYNLLFMKECSSNFGILQFIWVIYALFNISYTCLCIFTRNDHFSQVCPQMTDVFGTVFYNIILHVCCIHFCAFLSSKNRLFCSFVFFGAHGTSFRGNCMCFVEILFLCCCVVLATFVYIHIKQLFMQYS